MSLDFRKTADAVWDCWAILHLAGDRASHGITNGQAYDCKPLISDWQTPVFVRTVNGSEKLGLPTPTAQGRA